MKRRWQKYGLKPAQLISYKALIGDVSDNIPGVKGIGDKTAVKLLQQFGDLDGIYSNLDKVEPERLRALLRIASRLVIQNRKLSAIVTDVPVPFELDACAVRSYDRNKVVEIFRELAFQTMLSRLPDEIGAAPSAVPRRSLQRKLHHRHSLQALDDLALRLSYSGTFSLLGGTRRRQPHAVRPGRDSHLSGKGRVILYTDRTYDT